MKIFAFSILANSIFRCTYNNQWSIGNGLIKYAHMDNNPLGSFEFTGQNGAVVQEGNIGSTRGIIFTNGRIRKNWSG